MSKGKVVNLIKILAIIVAVVFGGVMMIAMYQSGKNNADFTWWITKTDGYGVYYEKYEQALSIQWLNEQEWEVDSVSEESGETTTENVGVRLGFEVPISGAEKDDFGTMIASGEYADIIDLTYSDYSPRQLMDMDVLIEITDYVEKYMPNYVAYMDANPDVKQLATEKDDNGKTHYYALYTVADEPNDNFMGYVYRRDWVVKYADVPSHVWDLENLLKDANDPTSVDTTKINYTDYYEAQSNNDWTGWKESSVTSFTCSEGDDPNNDYTDNVIFPSGYTKPIYISDWEWMFRAFKKAIIAEGFNGDENAYCTTIYYEGILGTGDLYSSFGGGSPLWGVNVDADGTKTAAFGGDSDNMQTYLKAMNTWYKNGWLDTTFETRTSDMFYKINLTGFSKGMVGLSQMGMAYPGTTIRETSKDFCTTTKPMVLGCAVPINDKYGTDAQKFVTPNAMYQAAKLGGGTGISTAIKSKDEKKIIALFTMFDWLYSEEGALLTMYGLSAEQYKSMSFSNDYYKKYGLDSAWYEENGEYFYHKKAWGDNQLQGALNGQRLATTYQMNGNKGNCYSVAVRSAMDEWKAYKNTTDITPYVTLLSQDQSNDYNKVFSSIRDHIDKTLPGLIKNYTDSGWASYKSVIYSKNYLKANRIFDSVFEKLG